MDLFTGKQYLAIDLANQYGHGLDRTTWANRLSWYDSHKHCLGLMINKADEPVLYQKALYAHRDMQAGKPTGFIMGLDSTASGIQLMGALMGCEVTARNVNLIDTGTREDIYSKVASKVNGKLGTKLTRSDVKPCTMTVFYGSTRQPQLLFGENTLELAAYYEVLAEELPGAMELMTDMQSCWMPNAKVMTWRMPDNHYVRAKINTPVDKKIEIDELTHATFTYRAHVCTGAPKGLSLAANIIHSIDAYVVREVLRRAYALNTQVATIHDSFWASPNDMNLVRELYIQVIAEVSKNNIMSDILNHITGKDVKFCRYNSDLYIQIANSEYALS